MLLCEQQPGSENDRGPGNFLGKNDHSGLENYKFQLKIQIGLAIVFFTIFLNFQTANSSPRAVLMEKNPNRSLMSRYAYVNDNFR